LHAFDAPVLVNVNISFKIIIFMLETVGIRVHVRNFRRLPLFIFGSSCKTCPSARCTTAANTVCKYINIHVGYLGTIYYS
jgi:hypothetical protein